MDPVTINLSGLNELTGQYGPYGYLIAYVLITAFLGINARRHIGLAGATQGDVQVSHSCRAIVAVLVGLVMFIATLNSGNDMFNRSIAAADVKIAQNYDVRYYKERAGELARQQIAAALARIDDGKCTCGMPLDEDGHCEALIARFGKQAVEKVACATEEARQ